MEKLGHSAEGSSQKHMAFSTTFGLSGSQGSLLLLLLTRTGFKETLVPVPGAQRGSRSAWAPRARHEHGPVPWPGSVPFATTHPPSSGFAVKY